MDFAPNYSTHSTASIRRGIKSLQNQIDEHAYKILYPEKVYTDWDKYSDVSKSGRIAHWKKEIRNFQTQINASNEELEKRGENNDN